MTNQVFALTEGLFAPIFFVWLGSSLNLRQLPQHPSAIGLGFAIGLSAALIHGAMVLTRQPWPIALLTSAQLGVPVAAATLGSTLGVLAPGENTAFVLGALITIALTAALSGEIAKVAAGTPTEGRTPTPS